MAATKPMSTPDISFSMSSKISMRSPTEPRPRMQPLSITLSMSGAALMLSGDNSITSLTESTTMPTNLLAFKIREVANSHSVPVLQSPMLARALYAHAELDQTIPSSLYAAVAQVLAYVYRLKAAMRGQGPMPQQPDPHVPPELDPLNKPARAGADA